MKFISCVICICMLLSGNRYYVEAQTWPNPELVDASTPDIVLETLVNRFGIKMDEEISWPFKLVGVNYLGSGTPYVTRYNIGTRDNLELQFVREESGWSIMVLNRQDYENVDQQLYDIELGVSNDETVATKRVRLIIATMNIFDNAPRIVYNGLCVAEELQSNLDTKCQFTVYHPDGIQNNPFRLEIEGRLGEERKFGFSLPYNELHFSKDYNLMVWEELRFEERAMYNFQTKVYDVVQNSSSISTLVQVIDVPSMPPIWTKPFTTERFLEKSAQTFSVIAVDGDTDINKFIWYELKFYEQQDYSQYISIEKNTGVINVKPINRDALKQEIFPFYIEAYKYDNRSWSIQAEAVIVVDDINDNSPVVFSSKKQLSIMENTYLTLPIDLLSVNDIDLGVHATYTVSINGQVSTGSVDYAKPFLLIPDNGYQESFFTITVSDAALLDYELYDWQHLDLTIIATENHDKTHIGQFEFAIDLINWNDELPIFSQSVYEISILETTGNKVNLINVTATDRDIDDRVEHSIIGMSELLITSDGQIWTQNDNTFDYERQPLVIVQIKAQDTLQINGIDTLHTAYAQLQINLIDVNDKTPEIRMPRSSPRMDENEQHPYLVTPEGIIASDPDTTADVRFKIDWDKTYATKAGQEARKELYENCFVIEADQSNPNRVIGYIAVNPEFPLLIDYEEYEVIYLHVIATDHNQEINEDSTDAVLTIRINDLNDNYPLFILDTLNTPRSVIEEAAEHTLIGTIFARDIDGPMFNNITYDISPASGTPDGIITIDYLNGELRVAPSAVVGCDLPVIFNLTYDIKLSDGELTTTHQINVWVYDINNRNPVFGVFDTVLRRYENITTGEIIATINSSDLDRDAPHNTIQYSIDYSLFAELSNYMAIDTTSGVLVAALQGDTVFDRDRGFKSFDIQIVIRDNHLGNGRVNQESKAMRLILLDVNDNAPELPSAAAFSPVISESAAKGTHLDTLIAVDIDDEITPNAHVGYAILATQSIGQSAEPPPNADNLFQVDPDTGALSLATVARGFYGQWALTVEAFDHGHEWDSHIQLRSKETYTITIEPYNFHTPEIVSHTTGSLHRLSFYEQQVNKPMVLVDGSAFPLLRAVDNDGGIFGEVSFTLVSAQDNNDADHFNVLQVDSKSAQLYIQRPIEARLYHVNVRAIDGGGRASEWMTLSLVFVDMSGEPVFEQEVWHTDFTENITGLDEIRQLPAAFDPKNVGIEDPSMLTEVFYYIDPNYNPSDARRFRLDAESRDLRLTEQLDREDIDRHVFRVVATNQKSFPQQVQSSAYLIVNVTVNDVNDNPPRFEYPSYGSGITATDSIGKHLLTVLAFDPDLDDVITYIIKNNSYSASDDSIRDILQRTPFELHPDTGELKLNFDVSTTMKGFIEFQIQAFDLVFHEDVCNVKIFIISDSNRVTFLFHNPRNYVEQQREIIGNILSKQYGYECFIDDVTKWEVNSVAQETMTSLRAHFILNNEAIETTKIYSMSNDVLFVGQMRSSLLEVGINWLDMPNVQSDDEARSEVFILQIILIAVSAVLGLILTALIVFFTIRDRSMSRQIKALSTTVFEPAEASKRAEPPNTNVFSVEGFSAELGSSNIANENMSSQSHDRDYRNDLVYDNLSLISSSSNDEFTGIESDPTFISNNNRAGANLSLINDFGQRKGVDNVNIDKF